MKGDLKPGVWSRRYEVRWHVYMRICGVCVGGRAMLDKWPDVYVSWWLEWPGGRVSCVFEYTWVIVYFIV